MAFDFTGKTAIVTGGTQGIGLEIAKGIVAGGGHVALLARNAAKGEAAVAALGEGHKFYSTSSMSPMHPRRARLSSRFLRTCRKPTS